VIPLIHEIVGENVRVIDPAPSVAKQTKRLLEVQGTRNTSGDKGHIKFYTSGNPGELRALLPVLLGELGQIQKVAWLTDNCVRLNDPDTESGD
jgi:glutamate racemase